MPILKSARVSIAAIAVTWPSALVRGQSATSTPVVTLPAQFAICSPWRVDSLEKRTFLTTSVREFQIQRMRFPSTTWRLRFELTSMNANDGPQATTIFPSDTTERSTVGWLVLDLR